MAALLPALSTLPRGDGHTVVVLPGLGADDRSTAVLRALIRRLGYDVVAWGLGRNVGPTPAIVTGLRRLVDRLAPVAPVTIIGWSLGGMYARAIASRHPELVRQVITLGSPLTALEGGDEATETAWDAVWSDGRPPSEPLGRPDQPRPDQPNPQQPNPQQSNLAVPSTSIYTRTDGVVPWERCILPPAARHENVEVRGSHCGLGVNPLAAYVIADRLRVAPDCWRPFRARPVGTS
jgi:pimeloyl-ACP methyl ester carboxylesterase